MIIMVVMRRGNPFHLPFCLLLTWAVTLASAGTTGLNVVNKDKNDAQTVCSIGDMYDVQIDERGLITEKASWIFLCVACWMDTYKLSQ